jgi:MscS family membrane protein
MEKFWNYAFLNNTVEEYAIVAGTIVLLLFIKRLISRFLASKLLRVIEGKQKSEKKERFIGLVLVPMERFLIAIISITALDKLSFPDRLHFKIAHVTSEDIVHASAVIILVVVFIRLCIKVLAFVSLIFIERDGHTKADNQLIIFFRDFFKVVLIIIGILLIIKFAFNKEIGSILTGLSIVGAALALAAKESLENLIASFIIFFDKPFVTGDTVKVQSFIGTVEKIGLRSTRIRTDVKTFITVPNKQMVDTVVDNISLRSQRKVELRLEISLSVTAQQLQQITAAIKGLLQQKTVIEKTLVYVMDTGKNAHILAVDYFTSMEQTLDEFIDFKGATNLAVITLLEEENISLAAANTTVVIAKQ